MVTKHKNLVLIGCLLIGFLAGIFPGYKGGMGLLRIIEENKDPGVVYAVRDLNITVSDEHRYDLITQLKKFADKDGFAIRVVRGDPNGYEWSVDLWRSDIYADGSRVVDEPSLDLSFWYTVQSRPVSDSVIDQAINDLKVYVYEIPGVTISER